MTISINKPCHENWAEMTPKQQGAFCGKCLKTVIDFSTKSVSEIKEFFNSTQEKKVCGRFETEQLTNLSFDDFYTQFKRFHVSKRMAIIVCFIFGMSLFENNNAFGQTKPIKQIKKDVAHVSDKKDTTKNCVKPTTEKNTIMGKFILPKNITDTTKTKTIDNSYQTTPQHLIMGEVIATPRPTVKPKKKK